MARKQRDVEIHVGLLCHGVREMVLVDRISEITISPLNTIGQTVATWVLEVNIVEFVECICKTPPQFHNNRHTFNGRHASKKVLCPDIYSYI